MEAELKPCPYCGGAASLALCGFGTAKVVCMDCGSEGSYSPTREEAIAAWNRRTPDGVGASLDPDCCPDCGDPECPGCDGVPYRDEDAAGVGGTDGR